LESESRKDPAPVQDSEIAALQTVVNSGCPAEAWPFLNVGQIVRIAGGSLSGLEPQARPPAYAASGFMISSRLFWDFFSSAQP